MQISKTGFLCVGEYRCVWETMTSQLDGETYLSFGKLVTCCTAVVRPRSLVSQFLQRFNTRGHKWSASPVGSERWQPEPSTCYTTFYSKFGTEFVSQSVTKMIFIILAGKTIYQKINCVGFKGIKPWIPPNPKSYFPSFVQTEMTA